MTVSADTTTRSVSVTYMRVPDGFTKVQDFYKDIFIEYKQHHDLVKEDLPDMELNVDFYNIRELEADTIARSMFTLIKNLYDVSTFNTEIFMQIRDQLIGK